MRILIVSTYERFGGSEQGAAYLADGLRVLGHEVLRAVWIGSGTPDPHTVVLGSRRRLPLPRIFDYANPLPALALRRLIGRWKPDVVSYHNINDFGFSLLSLLVAKEIPVVWTVQDWWPYGGFSIERTDGTPSDHIEATLAEGWAVRFPGLPRTIDALVHGIVRRARPHIVTMTDWLRRSLIASPIGGEPATVIPFGIDVERFAPRPEEPAGPPRILYVGRLNARKGYDLLEEAFRKLRNEFPGLELWAVGAHGPDRPVENGIRIFHTRPSEELPAFYAQATLLVCPGLETPGLVNLEALASGIPVVASDITPIREYLADDVATFFAYRDAGSLMNAITRVLKDPNRRRHTAHAGRLLVETKFSHLDMAKKYAKVFEALLRE